MIEGARRKLYWKRAALALLIVLATLLFEFCFSNYRTLFLDRDDYVTDFQGLSDAPLPLKAGTSHTYTVKGAPSDVYAIRIFSVTKDGAPLTKPIQVVVKGADSKRADTVVKIATTAIGAGDNQNPAEKTILLDLNTGEPSELTLEFSNVERDTLITAVVLNPSNNLMRFNLLRFLLVLAVGIFIWLSVTFKWNSHAFDISKRSHCLLVFGTLVLCIVITVLYCSSFIGGFKDISYPLQNGVNTYNPYIQQTDAFLKGQLHIDYPVSEKLLQLENPYDYSARKGISYLWDRAMYDGAYYSYFGIAPILNVYLPHYLLTGSLPADATVSSFYAISATAFISLFLIAYVVIYKKKVPLTYLCLGLVTLLLTSNILLMARGRQPFYYIAMIAGMAYLAAFMFFSLLAINEKGKILRPTFFALAGLSYAMLFLSRLNMALLAAFVVLPILYFGVLRNKPQLDINEEGASLKVTRTLGGKLIDLAALGFFVLLAVGFTLWYNQARFDSPFEFGTNYQLTVSDISKNKLRLSGIPGTIYHYFMQPLGVSGNFPNFSLLHSSLNNYGTYVYVDTGMGLFAIPLMLSLFLAFPTLRSKKKTPFAKSLLLCLLCGFFFVAFMNFCLGGVIFRYTADLTMLASVLSVILLFSFHEQTAEHSTGAAVACRTIGKLLMLLSCYMCIHLLLSVSVNLMGYDANLFVSIAELFGY